MAEQIPGHDSLDNVELAMAVEEVVAQICKDRGLSPAQRELLLLEIEERIANGEFGDEGGEGLAVLVKKRGPRKPSGQAGAEAEPFVE